MSEQTLPVAIIGAGPVGLAAAAHLLERGETQLVFEAGETIGANVLDWGHVRMFSPWEFSVDAAMVRLLEAHGWQMPPADELPTGKELVEDYMQPFANLPAVRDCIRRSARVVAISRRDIDKMKDAGRDTAPFVLRVRYGNEREEWVRARAVIDASGTWHNANPLGSGGISAIGEEQHRESITYGIPDIAGDAGTRYANQRVMVVGSGHSAINVLLDLVALRESHPQTQIVWAMRSTNLEQVYGGRDDDALPARGALGERIKAAVDSGAVQIVAPFRIREIADTSDDESGITVIGDTPQGNSAILVDDIIATTGSRPQLDMLRELRVDTDPSLESVRDLAPMIDPNIHSCGTVPPHGEAELRHPEKDFYIVGMKSYGRAPTFLLATGYEQVRSVVAGLAGDWDAARDVQLNLPETGVCSTDLTADGDACCGSSVANTVAIGLDSIPVSGD